MKAYLKYLAFAGFMLILLLWMAGFFKPKLESGEVKPSLQKIKGLSFQEVEKRKILEEPYVGEVEPEERAEIATPLSGRVILVKVKEGDCVKKGALLLRVEGEELEARLRASDFQVKEAEAEYRRALAQHEVARVTYERYAKLFKEGAVTPQEFDEVKGRLDEASQILERARASISASKAQKQAIASNLKYVNLTAPFSGCISEKQVDLGDLALPGKPLLVMEKEPFLFRVELPEKFFEEVKPGKVFKVTISNLETPLEAKVVERSSSIDPKTRTFKVKLLFKDRASLKSGILGWLMLPVEREALLIPEKAVLKRYDFTGVFVLRKDKTLELRWVKLGRSSEGKVEVLSGLSEGEKVVVDGLEKACDGCQVE